MSGIVLVTWTRFDLDFDPLTLDHALFFTKKCSKSEKSNPIFHLKGRATGLELTDLDSPMAECLSPMSLFSPILAIFSGYIGLKVGPNV